MSKLLSLIIAAAFASVNVAAVAAEKGPAADKKEVKKEAKKEVKKDAKKEVKK